MLIVSLYVCTPGCVLHVVDKAVRPHPAQRAACRVYRSLGRVIVQNSTALCKHALHCNVTTRAADSCAQLCRLAAACDARMAASSLDSTKFSLASSRSTVCDKHERTRSVRHGALPCRTAHKQRQRIVGDPTTNHRALVSLHEAGTLQDGNAAHVGCHSCSERLSLNRRESDTMEHGYSDDD